MTDHSTLERRLRDASAPTVWDDVSPDAWQENERRVAADQARRAGRRLRVVAAAAAAVLIVGAGVYGASQLDGSSLAPADGGSKGAGGPKGPDPFKPKDLVGKTVVLERYEAHGAPVVHSAYLTRPGGKRLRFCDLYKGADTRAKGSGGASCSGRRDTASPLAFVMGTASSDPVVKGVSGAVVSSVTSVKAWFGDSAEPRNLRLHALGVGGFQAFGVSAFGPQARVVRLAAYDENDAVLLSFEVPDYGGDGAAAGECKGARVLPHTGTLPPGTSLALNDVSVRISGKSQATVCLPLHAMATAPLGPRSVLVVVPPESGRIMVRSPAGDSDASLVTFDAHPWRFAIITPPDGVALGRLKVVLLDATGQDMAVFGLTRQVQTSP